MKHISQVLTPSSLKSSTSKIDSATSSSELVVEQVTTQGQFAAELSQNIVQRLQHLARVLARQAAREHFDVTKPHGFAVFFLIFSAMSLSTLTLIIFLMMR